MQHVFPSPPRTPWYKFWSYEKHKLEFLTAIILFIIAILGFCTFVYEKASIYFSSQTNAVVKCSTQEKSDLNYSEYKYHLGIAYKDGNGIPQDFISAFKSFKDAADRGNAKAQFEVGKSYLNGVGVKKNSSEAQKYFLLSANQGVADAQFMIGGMLAATGKNNPDDYKTALKWYVKAANQNHVLAAHNIGVMYYYGHGVEKNCVEAYNWFTKAANLGRSDDQYLIGLMLLYDSCVDKNEDLAEEWLIKAANQGHIEAKNVLKKID